MFLVLLVDLSVTYSVCLCVRPSNYLNSRPNEWICMKPEVCFGLKNNWLKIGDDPDYDPDHMDWR